MTRTHATAWLLCSALVIPALHAAQNEDERSRRISDSIAVLQDLTAAPDNRIPDHLLTRAEAIVVIPSLVKGGFIIGAKHGTGVISVRDRRLESWSDPAFVKMTGGSIGWQIGVESVDLVLLVMNRNGVDQLLEDRFTVGGSLSVAAGPVGRSAGAATNAQVSAQILAYSRAKGLFAGATLEGAGLREDQEANRLFYGAPLGLRQIIMSPEPRTAPPAAAAWRQALQRLTTTPLQGGDRVRAEQKGDAS
jgi:lipid-binding SYLF domain-containing protein